MRKFLAGSGQRILATALVSSVLLSGCSEAAPSAEAEVPLGPDAAWTIQVPPDNVHSVYRVPGAVVVGDILVLGNNDLVRQGVTFSDAATGESLWSLETEQFVIALTSEAVVTRQSVRGEAFTYNINVYDIATGDKRFSHQYVTLTSWPSMVATEDAYFVVEDDVPEQTQYLTAVDLATGDTRWQLLSTGGSDDPIALTPTPIPAIDSVETLQQTNLRLATDSPVVFFSDDHSETGQTRVLDTATGDVVGTVDTRMGPRWTGWATDNGSIVVTPAPNSFIDHKEHGYCTQTIHVVDTDLQSFPISTQVTSIGDGWECHSMDGRPHITHTQYKVELIMDDHY